MARLERLDCTGLDQVVFVWILGHKGKLITVQFDWTGWLDSQNRNCLCWFWKSDTFSSKDERSSDFHQVRDWFIIHVCKWIHSRDSVDTHHQQDLTFWEWICEIIGLEFGNTSNCDHNGQDKWCELSERKTTNKRMDYGYFSGKSKTSRHFQVIISSWWLIDEVKVWCDHSRLKWRSNFVWWYVWSN